MLFWEILITLISSNVSFENKYNLSWEDVYKWNEKASTYLPTYLPTTYLSIYLSIYLPIYLSICVRVCVCVCVCVWVCVCGVWTRYNHYLRSFSYLKCPNGAHLLQAQLIITLERN